DFVVLRRNLLKEYEEGVQAQKVFVRKNLTNMDAATKRAEIKTIASLIGEQNTADHAMESMEKAVKGLAETHSELGKAFDRSSVVLDRLLADFVEEGKRVKKF